MQYSMRPSDISIISTVLYWDVIVQCGPIAISGVVAEFGEIAKFGVNISPILAR
jgi:ribulose 1,5-bisphosphate synthetase/thiazole synthase